MLLYRLILILVMPVLGVRLLLALAKGTETTGGLAQRFGGGNRPENATETIWLHGASLGELTAAKSLVFDLLKANPNIRVLVSANTMPGRDLVTSWKNGRVIPTLAPLDNLLIVGRFFNLWTPSCVISLENEIWPNRILAARARGIPVVVVAGRLSIKSAAMWARFPHVARRVLGAIDALFPMDHENGQRFAKLGLPEESLQSPVNLKSAVVLAEPDPGDLETFSKVFERTKTVLAASTHQGEEELILQAFATAHHRDPDLRLILAPRHAARSGEVAQLIRQTGLKFTSRSSGEQPRLDDPVYLADTTGEMALWYCLVSLVLLGGSWVPKGGHSPVEAVQFGAIVAHGPDISNHKAAYAALSAARASVKADGPREILDLLCNMEQWAERSASRDTLAKSELAKLRHKTAATGPILEKITELTRKS